MTTGRGVDGGAAGGLASRWKQGVIKGGLLRKPVWAEENIGNPTGPPKASPGCREGVLGTELGLDTMRRHSSYSEWSRSLVIARQGYRQERGEVRRNESGRESPEHFVGERTKGIKDQWGF